MSTSRSVKRKSTLLNRKEAIKNVKKVESLVNNTEKTCCVCKSKFDPQANKEQLDSWRVRVYEKHAELYCDACFATSEKCFGSGESERDVSKEQTDN